MKIKFQQLEIYELLRDVDTRYRLMNGFRKYLLTELKRRLKDEPHHDVLNLKNDFLDLKDDFKIFFALVELAINGDADSWDDEVKED